VNEYLNFLEFPKTSNLYKFAALLTGKIVALANNDTRGMEGINCDAKLYR